MTKQKMRHGEQADAPAMVREPGKQFADDPDIHVHLARLYAIASLEEETLCALLAAPTS